jgi:hypothetical protein
VWKRHLGNEIIVSHGEVVRPSQLIASVLRTKGWATEAAGRKNKA